MFSHMLVPLDGSPLAETALLPASALARRFGAEILLMRAMLPTDVPEGPTQSLGASGSQVYLERLAGQLTKSGITVHTVLTDEEPAKWVTLQLACGKAGGLVCFPWQERTCVEE